MNDNATNIIIASILSITVMLSWNLFFNKNKINSSNTTKHEKIQNNLQLSDDYYNKTPINKENSINISSKNLSGKIQLKGLRIDDIILLQYKQNINEDKPMSLLSPSYSNNPYFVEIGWISKQDIELPNQDTLWHADNKDLTPTQPINCTWSNKDNVKFIVNITIDENYMLHIKQSIINNSNHDISLKYYGIINRNYVSKEKLVNILHQGPIGVINKELTEYSYNKIKNKNLKEFKKHNIDWLGITDKYWLVSFIPDQNNQYYSNFRYSNKYNTDKYQVDFFSDEQIIQKNTQKILTHRLFVGPKKVKLLDQYAKQYNIRFFDRAIDFGWFYLITKPLFNILNFFYYYVGNFGVSILLVTVIIKLLLFSLANKSYQSMNKIKKLQPEIERIQNLYKSDKIKMNQEIMELYKKEKVNPVSGCLPVIIQIPIFFSIYKVLYVTIEMRHAPFFGWIKDLSAPDPTNIFNLFGLLNFELPEYLVIGAWPIIMAITMHLQQKLNYQSTDPMQAQIIKFMPLIFLVTFNNFPAGLLIYWSWNNMLSIAQQYYINKSKN